MAQLGYAKVRAGTTLLGVGTIILECFHPTSFVDFEMGQHVEER